MKLERFMKEAVFFIFRGLTLQKITAHTCQTMVGIFFALKLVEKLSARSKYLASLGGIFNQHT